MASNLTVTSTNGSASVSRAFNAATGIEGEEAGDIFAALLGATGGTPEGRAQTQAGTGQLSAQLGNLAKLSLDFDKPEAANAEDAGDKLDDAAAIAAPIELAQPIQTPPEAMEALAGLVDQLAALKTRLETGEAVSGKEIEAIDEAAEKLAASFGIELGTLPALDKLRGLVTPLDPQHPLAKLTQALSPLAETLAMGEAAAPDARQQAMAVGERLSVLLVALNDEGRTAVTALEGADMKAQIEAAIAKLAGVGKEAPASPALATPQLQLTEPVLTGKAEARAEPQAKAEATSGGDAGSPALAEPKLAPRERNAGEDKPSGKDRDEGKAFDVKPRTEAVPVKDGSSDPQTTTQPIHTASRIDAAAAPRIVQVGYQTSQQQLNLPQLAFELVRQASDGNTRFQIRLDPAELGKIDVQLDIDPAGQVNARLTVERAETLDMIQRDQRGLERALQQAGLDSSKANLEFSLKQNSGQGQGHEQGGSGRQPRFGRDGGEADEPVLPTVNLYRGSLSASGVNIIA